MDRNYGFNQHPREWTDEDLYDYILDNDIEHEIDIDRDEMIRLVVLNEVKTYE